MNFYVLTYPEYISDQAERKNNPVKLIPNISIPSIVCEDCGIWSSSERVRRKVEFTSKAKEILKNKCVHVNDWDALIKDLSFELKIDIDLLKPGAELGIPRGEIVKFGLHDFIHPFPGITWVSHSVKDMLFQNKATGVEFCEVDIDYRKIKSKVDVKEQKLWEIVVKGKAWRKGINYENSLACPKCNRTVFRNPEYLQIDESTWDGSDFFTLDLNPNIIVVTERIYEILKQSSFTNYLCKKIITKINA